MTDLITRLVRVKCSPEDTVGDFKKLISAQIGTKPEKIVLKRGYVVPSFVRPDIDVPPRYETLKDHITLYDYEINDGRSLDL